MAMTALDVSTHAVIFPFDEGLRVGVCRDPHCGGKMAAVRGQVTDDGVVLARAHWRHVTRSEGCRDTSERMTEWHRGWQAECDDPNRVEVRVARDGGASAKVRVADIVTRFGLVIEVQHSAMKPETVRARENHYGGNVLWLFDQTGERSSEVEHLDDDTFRWTAVKPHVIAAKCIRAVDTGDRIMVLPASNRCRINGPDLLIPYTMQFGREEFVAAIVNGEVSPFADVETDWMRDHLAKLSRRRTSDQKRAERLVDQDARRSQFGRSECDFGGDRGRLVSVDPDAQATSHHSQVRTVYGTEIWMCAKVGCLSAANKQTGYCFAHSPIYRERPAS